VPAEQARAFAPGRVNLIGEHTDYNCGLALPFAIAQGVTVQAERRAGRRVQARAAQFGEEDEFSLDQCSRAGGWRDFVRGAVAELGRAGWTVGGARLSISGDLAQGAGLSSSAALEVALCLALDALYGPPPQPVDRIAIARICAQIERDWAGANTGLLDQLASLYGEPDAAVQIDFRSLQIEPVELALGRWRLVLLDSGERHRHASSGYNQRRAECARACELLGVRSLRDASPAAVADLPAPLRERAEHVLGENERVRGTVAALSAGELYAVGSLLNASHRSLRELFEVSTPAVEATVRALLDAGAAGARLIGGGFGGAVLGLLPPGASAPPAARGVSPSAGARLL
jgi:galactokinase